MNIFDPIPNEIIILLALNTSLTSILSKSCTRFYNLIYNNNDFWKQKFINDFYKSSIHKIPPYHLNITSKSYKLWKDIYKNHHAILVCGYNEDGQLGLNTRKNILIPTPLLNTNGNNFIAKSICTKVSHTMIIDTNDNVWSIGYNNYGQLGLNVPRDNPLFPETPGVKLSSILKNGYHSIVYDFHPNALIPERVPNIKASMVACGGYHSMIIDLDNNIYAFGANNFGQLGLNDTSHQFIPTQIPDIKARFVTCGAYFTIIIDLNDDIWSFGSNGFGQLGLGDRQNRLCPIRIFNDISIKIKYVSCGICHVMMIDYNNNLLGFGYNQYGQLGLTDNYNRTVPIRICNLNIKSLEKFPFVVKSVCCGEHYTMFIDDNDCIWAFGYNSYGQLGLDDKENRYSPVQIYRDPESILHHSLEENKDEMEEEIKEIKNSYPTNLVFHAKSVFCGSNHSIIVDDNYDLWGCGDNNFGQLGLQDRQSQLHYVHILKDLHIKSQIISCGNNNTIIIQC